MGNTYSLSRWLSAVAFAVLVTFALACRAQDSAPADSGAPVTVQSQDDDWHGPDHEWRHKHHRGDKAIVTIGHDSHLAAGETADSVVSIMGSSMAEGDVADAVVSIFGNTRVSGTVGDAAVAVFGNTYVDGKVRGDVVAVFGNVELGPEAEVGHVVAVGGVTKRDPQSTVHGGVENVGFGAALGDFTGLRTWFERALLLGRPLAFGDHLLWVWIVAASFLALYVLLAVAFPGGIERCARTFADYPAHSILTAIAGALLAPIVMILLCVTVIGIPVVPFFAMALVGATLFGKAALLAWIGQRILAPLRGSATTHPALGVLIAGIIVTFIYLVPILGSIVFNILGVLGFGAALYAAILTFRSSRNADTAATSTDTKDSSTSNPAAEPPMTTASTEQTATPHAQPASTPPANISATLPRAGFWLRMGALVIDVLIVGIVLGVLHHGGHFELLALAIYGAAMWKLKRTTLGGIVCGIAVVRVDEREIDWATAIVRALACFLSLVVAGLGFLWIAFDDNKQAWHDKIAGTVVVCVPKGISLL